MPRFEPFAAVRYDPAVVSLDDAVAPPYDVISGSDREVLAARSPYNVVHVDVVERIEDGYEQARCQFRQWLADGVLRTDPEPGFYVYRMGFTDSAGQPRQTVGVVGALELSAPGQGSVLPHERTLPKARDDRLRLMRACQANLSPVWCLSLAEGLTALCVNDSPPVARCTDEEGVHHRLWRVTRPGVVAAMAEVVASAPVVIADGHHRYETALAFRDEQARRGRSDGGVGHDADLLMTFVVELGEAQVGVRPIHRLITGLSEPIDVAGALASGYAPRPLDPSIDPTGPRSLQKLDGPVLVTSEGRWLLGPRGRADEEEPDSVRLERSLVSLGPHQLGFDHRADEVVNAVAQGRAVAGVLLRPLTVAQISAAARRGQRLPEKTTFFHPKPRTGMLFRRLR